MYGGRDGRVWEMGVGKCGEVCGGDGTCGKMWGRRGKVCWGVGKGRCGEVCWSVGEM